MINAGVSRHFLYFRFMLNAISKVQKNSNAAILALLAVAVTYLWVWFMADAPAGGQDSWNHYLYARWAPHHPKLLLDQWGKPFFTLVALPFAPFGLNSVYFLNFISTLGTAWICYLTGRKLSLRNPWLLIILFGWQPIVFANFHSSLTEPTNALILVLMCYLFVSHKIKSAIFVASFLPLVRSEGMILLLAIIPFIFIRGYWKYLPLLFSGTAVFAIFAGFVSGDWKYFYHNNPYIRHELVGRFDPGSGALFHYVNSQREITGVLITLLLIVALVLTAIYVKQRINKKTPNEISQYVLWLFLPLFFSFFIAHTVIWYTGTMGSHGLIRVFVVVAPIAAIIAQFALHRLMSFNIKKMNQMMKIVIIAASFFIAFSGAHMPYPWQKGPSIEGFPGQSNVDSALNYIQHNHLNNKVLVHQLPALDVQLNFDPWATAENAKSFYVWSIDTHEGKDWMPDSCVVLWDNVHARRDGPMPLHVMRSLKQYKEIAYFPSKLDTLYDVRLFLKVPQK